jgi:ABC-type transport system involved in multi-copper enzyme maturation permease subunit
MTPLRDIVLVALFEWIRAVRTWRALALVALYIVASAGGANIFVEVLGELETALAETLGVPPTAQVGVMLDQLRESDRFRREIADMTGVEDVDVVLRYPVLAIFHLWLGLILVPFVGATAAAESISGDLATRAIRYEAVRTGRLELVTGRFLGQALLTGAASVIGTVGAWTVGVFVLYGTDPVELGLSLVQLSMRAWLYSLAYVGMGIGISQWTANPNLARALAIVGVAATWPAYFQARFGSDEIPGFLADFLLQVLPQGWMAGLWTPQWPLVALACLAMAYTWVGIGYLRFARRDL